MLINELKKYKLILGSASQRRKELLSMLDLVFDIKTCTNSEVYPKNLHGFQIAEFLAKQKSEFISKNLKEDYLLITADTLVFQENEIFHKPKNKKEAKEALMKLSAKKHTVITGVYIKSKDKSIVFSSKTDVSLNRLSEEEIIYYIEKYRPYDKAGSYGIQEWIGYIGIKKINGSYNNVVGLPTEELYQKLKLFI